MENRQAIARYKEHPELLQTVLTFNFESVDPAVMETAGQGIILPQPARILAKAFYSRQVDAVNRDCLHWVRMAVRDAWLPEVLPSLLVAVPGLVGEDAFIGGWSLMDSRFQIIITQTSVNLLISNPVVQIKGPPPSPEELALMSSGIFLNIRDEFPAIPWQVISISGLSFGFRQLGGNLIHNWEKSLYYLTEGRNVKYAWKRPHGETSERELSGGLPARPAPWFIYRREDAPQGRA